MTPRDLLLNRHRSDEPRLDRIRKQVVTQLRNTIREIQSADSRPDLWDTLRSLRGHLIGLGAAWVLVALLHFGGTGDIESPRRTSASPQQVLAALRQYRRDVSELVAQPSTASESRTTPRRRGQLIIKMRVA